MAKKSYCVICEKEKKGLVAEEDSKIATIRWIKKNITHNEKGGVLVVCKECYPKYAELRKKYMTRQITYVALIVVFGVLALILSPTLSTIIAIALLVLFLYVLDFLNFLNYRAVKLNVETEDS